jgi:hypothetical protein
MRDDMKIPKMACCILTFMILSTLAEAPAQAERSGAVRRAQQVHEEGVRLFQEGRYREAVSAFEHAERLAPNPLNQYNQARCYQELGEHATALSSIDQYLATPELTAEDRVGAEQLRDELVEALRPAAPPPVEFSYPQPVVREGSSLAGPWALFGTGLGLLVVGGVLDIVAFVRSDPDATVQFGTYGEYVDWRTRARNIAIGGDVLVSVGAAVAVAGLIWLIVARSRRSTDRASGHPMSFAAIRARMTLHMGFGL